MISKSESVYKAYKECTLINLAHRKNSKLINLLYLILTLLVLLCIPYKLNPYKISGFLLSVSALSFLILISLIKFRILCNEKHIIIKGEDLGEDMLAVTIEKTRESIKENCLYSKEGIEYLIDTYMKKSQSHRYTKIAFLAIAVTSFINQGIYALIFGGEKELNALIFRYNLIISNSSIFTYFCLSLILIMGIEIFILLQTKGMKRIFLGGKYDNLIEILNDYILLEVISTNEEKKP